VTSSGRLRKNGLTAAEDMVSKMVIFEDQAPSSRRFTRKDFQKLRKSFDGEDLGPSRSIGVKAPRYLQTRSRPERDDPESQFLYSDSGTQAFLLKNFPDLDNDREQKEQAARWAAVINLYFRAGWTDSRIEKELGWEKGTAGSIVQQIRRKIRGLRRNGKAYSPRKPGRPRKITVLPVPETPAPETLVLQAV
jgi:hypothetical protein